MTEPITIDNLLLRGCNLRNTEWIVGVVVYTGHDTKIMMNAGITPSKRARIAREMNFNVVCNFGILLIICVSSFLRLRIHWWQTSYERIYHFLGRHYSVPELGAYFALHHPGNCANLAGYLYLQ
ncbi:hypothetical protein LB505_001641 [Fusarium chuoi]|nr:hypothetical protein LB505_001641 [Fusarium chuoi]